MKRVKSTAMAAAFIEMAVTMKASGRKIQGLVVKGVLFSQMEDITYADFRKAKETDTVNLSGWMDLFTRETGKQISKTDMVLVSGQMANFMRATSKQVKETDMVL